MDSSGKHFHLEFSEEVQNAIFSGQPVVGLETTIISHGMPYPENLEFAQHACQVVREAGAIPAPIAIINGRIVVGLSDPEMDHISRPGVAEKAGVRDIAGVLSKKLTGSTTVSSTIRLASLAGITVCTTGGIGGVHSGYSKTMDVSQDLVELSRVSVILVSSGAKAILDIPRTLEYLETFSVPVLGYQTDEFPAFYSRQSGHGVSVRSDSPAETARIFYNHRSLGLSSALLVTNPVPQKDEIDRETISRYVSAALDECDRRGISGKEVTPFLLQRLYELSSGKTLATNRALAINNYRLSAEIAVAWSRLNQKL